MCWRARSTLLWALLVWDTFHSIDDDGHVRVVIKPKAPNQSTDLLSSSFIVGVVVIVHHCCCSSLSVIIDKESLGGEEEVR